MGVSGPRKEKTTSELCFGRLEMSVANSCSSASVPRSLAQAGGAAGQVGWGREERVTPQEEWWVWGWDW